eukprot:jgi/Psemu1/321478/estExt_fgenesh1_pg.C_30021
MSEHQIITCEEGSEVDPSLVEWPTDPSQFDLKTKIGQGAFASVWRASTTVVVPSSNTSQHDEAAPSEEITTIADTTDANTVADAVGVAVAATPEPRTAVVDCAIKILNLDHVDSNLSEIRLEVQSMRLSSHPNVLSCFAAFVRSTDLWLVTQLMRKGSSLHCLQGARRIAAAARQQQLQHHQHQHETGTSANEAATGRVPIPMEDHILYIMHETLLGLQYIHEHNGQIHRDIKAGNILIDHNGDVRIADFGVSGWLVNAGKQQEKAKTFVGTPCWMAPEVMEQINGYDYKADIWSLGITAMELAKGYAPYAKYPPMKVLILTIQEDPPSLDTYDVEDGDETDDWLECYDDEEFSSSFRSFVDSCLQKNPARRPATSDLLESKPISDYKDPIYREQRKRAFVDEVCSLVKDVGSTSVAASAAAASDPDAGDRTSRCGGAAAGGGADHDNLPGCSPVSIFLSTEDNDRPAGTTWVFADGSQVLSSSIANDFLTEEDVASVTKLMAEWARTRSLAGALKVEDLLKRIVDDMRAGNSDVYVSTRIYTLAIEAWGKSDHAAGAERAQSIHDNLVRTFRDTGNARLKPTAKSCNTLMLAWAKSQQTPGRVAVEGAERVLKTMLTAASAATATDDDDDDEKNSAVGVAIRPDSVTFAILLNLYARNGGRDSVAKAERLVDSMGALGVTKTGSVYTALQEVYVRSDRKDAPERTLAVLKEMLAVHAGERENSSNSNSNSNTRSRPRIANYNNVLCAYSRTPSKDAAIKAVEMVNRIEASIEDGGYDTEPDRLTYFLAILACSRCPNATFGANLAEPLLERMEARSRDEAQRREELSITASRRTWLDIECFNVVLTALSKSRDPDAVDRIFAILERMEEYADNENGAQPEPQPHLRPTTRSFNTALNALSYKRTTDAANRAEETLARMFRCHANANADANTNADANADTGVTSSSCKPDAFSYTAILRCYQRIATPEAAERGHAVLARMEELYEANLLDEPPDTYHYTIVCSTWSLSKSEKAPHKCIELLARMKEKDRDGWPRVKPNIRTYNAVLDCLSRSLQANRAEELLYHMLSLVRNGDDGARPDPFSFNAVINAFIYSKQLRDAGRRAESVLERALEHAEEDGGAMPEIKSFTSILGYYGRQKAMDSPYRARYVLNRLVTLFMAGHKHLSPHVSCFTSVMESYASQRNRDAGECSEELLRTMIKLQKRHDAVHLEVNTGVVNCVINAWAESIGNDDAGVRAERLVDLMETKSDEGVSCMVPNHRSYNTVIKAWSKCNNRPDKAERARAVLHRAKKRHEQGKLGDPPSEYAYSLVIQACAFSRNPSDPAVPARLTGVPESATRDDLKRVVSRCCRHGRVNEFVLQGIKQACSDEVFRELMGECPVTVELPVDSSCDWKEAIQLSNLPEAWVAREPRAGTKRKRNFRR